MPEDAAVIEDKPGKCPICGMQLYPARLDSKFWCPTHQTLVVRDGPGKCPMDGKDLVQVTLSTYWTCSDAPTEHLLDPGKCGNGQPRKIAYEIRAHGDHNPRHGGQFFMAEDQWHHVEGALPAQNLFRLYFYDNFTKPLPPSDFTARLDREMAGKVETIPLTSSPDKQTLQARLGPGPMPVKVKVWVNFKKGAREQPFDFSFDKVSVDTAAPVTTTKAPAPTTPAAKPASTASAAATPKPVPAAAPTPAPAPAPAPAQTMQAATPQPAEGGLAPRILDNPVQIPPALADALDETRLPNDTEGLLTELQTRSKEIEATVNEGNLSQVWLSATGAKTVALVLDARSSSLPERQRVLVRAAVKRIVTAAWDLDAYGDLGNREKIIEAYERMAAAVNDLKEAHAR